MNDDDESKRVSTRHWTHYDSDYFDKLISRMRELRDQTDPSKGEESAQGKDMAAFQALECAGRLVEGLVGWAIAHQVGLAAEGLSFVPLGPGGGHREQPEYLAARTEVDSHRHERLGDQLIRGHSIETDPMTGKDTVTLAEIEALTARRAAINLLHANPGAMPHAVATSLVEALRAVEMNDIRPIFQPTVKGRKVGLVEKELQLQALCFVQFRYASGLMRAGEAWNEVVEQYGVPLETARTWSKRLRRDDEFGQLKVSRMVGFAKNIGAQIKTVSKADRFRALSELEGHHSYGKDALVDAARKYRAEQGYTH